MSGSHRPAKDLQQPLEKLLNDARVDMLRYVLDNAQYIEDAGHPAIDPYVVEKLLIDLKHNKI